MRKKQSIRLQMAITTIILIAVTILICVLANALLLQKVYVNNKKSSLIETYELLNECKKEELEDESYQKIVLQKICDVDNLKMIILDDENMVKFCSAMDWETLSTKLVQYSFGIMPIREVMEENGKYVTQKTVNARTKSSYIEMWGRLDNGYIFLLVTALESMEESAVISRNFMCITGFFTMILGGVIAWVYSGKISNPILRLAELSEKIKMLDFEAKYTGEEKNEIAVLGNNMNSLSKSLERTISELKTANMELQQDIKKKEEVDIQRKEFIGNVSHELKTPIALIQGYAEGLREGISDDPENIDYYLEVICDEAERMNRMVKNLMALNELESGYQKMTMERFDLVDLVKNYINNADVLLKDTDTKLTIKAPESLYVWGDEFKIEEVVMNYFSNAVHYVSGAEKEICITVEKVGEKARVTVFNTGSYIPEEDIAYIWDKFYKVDKARSRSYGGSGVGLSIVKAIMSGLGQQYGVENREDGVAFWFELAIK